MSIFCSWRILQLIVCINFMDSSFFHISFHRIYWNSLNWKYWNTLRTGLIIISVCSNLFIDFRKNYFIRNTLHSHRTETFNFLSQLKFIERYWVRFLIPSCSWQFKRNNACFKNKDYFNTTLKIRWIRLFVDWNTMLKKYTVPFNVFKITFVS